jgi:hypothetical protein
VALTHGTGSIKIDVQAGGSYDLTMYGEDMYAHIDLQAGEDLAVSNDYWNDLLHSRI